MKNNLNNILKNNKFMEDVVMNKSEILNDIENCIDSYLINFNYTECRKIIRKSKLIFDDNKIIDLRKMIIKTYTDSINTECIDTEKLDEYIDCINQEYTTDHEKILLLDEVLYDQMKKYNRDYIDIGELYYILSNIGYNNCKIIYSIIRSLNIKMTMKSIFI